jgi:hypothetical protein
MEEGHKQQPVAPQEGWKMIAVMLTTFDVTAPPGMPPPPAPVPKSLELVREDQEHLIFRWSTENGQPIEGTLAIVDWEEFLGQVQERNPGHWASSPQLPGPMGEGGLPAIMRQLTTTPTYQLFLAAMDLTAFLYLYQSGTPDDYHFLPYLVYRQFGALSGFVPTVTGGNRLFFVSDQLTSERDQALEELVQNGKLGRVTLAIDARVRGSKYYVPYAVPGGFTTPVMPVTKQLWDAARGEYFASR